MAAGAVENSKNNCSLLLTPSYSIAAVVGGGRRAGDDDDGRIIGGGNANGEDVEIISFGVGPVFKRREDGVFSLSTPQ
jgi:hypothetical protein